MMHYETDPMPTAKAREFARVAEELIGTDIEIDHHDDEMSSVTVFELESEKEVRTLRYLETKLCS